MSLTVNSKPSGFRPVGGGELIYQFTESSLTSKPNYRVEIELNGLSLPVFQYRPNASLVINADIAPMLRAALEMSFTAADRFVSTYVKYQAVWDGGSDSQVNLSGDVIYAYIGVNHDLNYRTTFDITNGKFLIPTTKLYAWAGRTAYVEFLATGFAAATWGVYYCPYTSGPIVSLGTVSNTTSLQSFTSNAIDADGKIQVRRLDSVLVWAPKSAAAANSWNGVAYGNFVWVAVASSGSGNRVMTYNGSSWTIQTSAADYSWNSVCYDEDAGRFLAVAFSGGTVDKVMTSDDDGVTWTLRNAATNAGWRSVCRGNGKYVAVANSGTSGQRAMYSADGVTWTICNTPIAGNEEWYSVCYGNGKYMAVGTGGIVMSSQDGITWTEIDSGNTENWLSVAYGNDKFCAVGDSSYSMTSQDGINWDTYAMPSADVWSSVTFHKSYGFIAVSYDAATRSATSFSGEYWTTKAMASTAGWTCVVGDPNVNTIIAVADSGAGARTGQIEGLDTTDIEVEVLPECTNPIYLKWINDLGGTSTWLFSYNQVYGLSPQMLWRDKKLTVNADILSFEQWKMLEELNKDGIEYGENKKSGALCVDFTDESNPINVFVEPQDDETMTKMSRHNFNIILRYEKIPNILL